MNMSEEKLILLVQEYKHLYDLSDPNYHNNLVKDNSWEEIGKTLRSTGEECKNKWKSLRESYRKAMNARKTKSGQSAKKIKPWRLESQMEFVKSYLFSQSEEEISNFSALRQSPPSTASHNSSSFTDEIEKNERELQNQQSDKPEDAGIITNEFGNNQKQKSSLSVGKKSTFEKNKSGPSGTAAEMLHHYMNMKMNSPRATGDQLTKYFQSIEETVRTLPPSIQIRLKSQISQLVHNAELEAINTQMPKNPHPPFSFSQQQSNINQLSHPILSPKLPIQQQPQSQIIYPTYTDL